MTQLALLGGPPVRTSTWPSWPEISPSTEAAMLESLRTGRWSLTWKSQNGGAALERRFAEAFAKFNGSKFAVSTDHGSSALLIALEALDIGPGDHVIVPSTTWVAPATAVLRVGATPILADVDPQTGCITAETLRAAATAETRAAIVVHLACNVASLDELEQACHQSGIRLIEDCSQAHGAQWDDRNVGTFGDVGVFSLGAAKALSGGEGGVATTDDQGLYRRLQMLRADSREYSSPSPPGPDEFELIETGGIFGANYCMSEFSAGVLLQQLQLLEPQHTRRDAGAGALEAFLTETPGVRVVKPHRRVTRRSIYEYAFQIDRTFFSDLPTQSIGRALTAELGTRIHTPRDPLYRSSLFRPESKARYAQRWHDDQSVAIASHGYPGAEYYVANTLLLHHSTLLNVGTMPSDICLAIRKVQENASALHDFIR